MGLCRKLPLPEPEPELVFFERGRDRKAPLIRARVAALPLREPSNDSPGSAEMKVQKEGQQNLRVRAPGVIHQAKAVLSEMPGRPRESRSDSCKTSEPML
jgi:hypothetical protein